jgi:hypothetical protein
MALTHDRILCVLSDEEPTYQLTNPMLSNAIEGSISEIEEQLGRQFLISVLEGRSHWTVYKNERLLVSGLPLD